MGKQRLKKGDIYKITHNTFFEETFGTPSFGTAFLKKTLPRKIRKQLDLDKLTVEKTKFRDKLFRETRPDIVPMALYAVKCFETEKIGGFVKIR